MYQVKRFNKYRNESTVYNGTYYASKLEAAVARELDFRLKARKGDPLRILNWDKQIRVPIVINGETVCTYIVDFRYQKEDKTIVWCEAKGMETDVFRIKKKLFEAVYLKEHPGEEYEIIKR